MEFSQEQESKDLEQQKQIDYLKQAVEPDPEDEEVGDNPDINPPEEDEEDVELDLFGQPIKPAGKPKSVKPKVNAEKPANKDDKYGPDWICLVYDQRIPVPEDDMSLDKIRHYLEMDYPQFSKDRTEMMVDKAQKYIIPNVAKAPKKG